MWVSTILSRDMLVLRVNERVEELRWMGLLRCEATRDPESGGKVLRSSRAGEFDATTSF